MDVCHAKLSQHRSMKHPLLRLSGQGRLFLLSTVAALTIICLAILRVTDPSRLSGKPPGIVGFELAGTAAASKRIVEGWGELGRTAAAFNLGFDYLFIVSYSTLMALLCLWATARCSGLGLAAFGVLVAWLQWAAGLLDCIENAALLRILFHGVSNRAANIARVSSLGKFSLIACGAIYVISSLFWGKSYNERCP